MKLKREYIVVGSLSAILLMYIAFRMILQQPIVFDSSVGSPGLGSLKLAGKISQGTIQKNIMYCGNQKLDLYLPRTKVYDKSPLVIFIHGGGWHANNKTSDKNIFALVDGLRDKGFTIASINYRETPQNQFPAPVEDALCSVRYLRSHADLYALDESKFAVVGFSAGGQLAAMVGTLPSQNPFNNGQYRAESSRVRAVVTVAGVFDLARNLKPNSIANVRNLMQAVPSNLGSPMSYVSSDDPAFMLVRGDKDSVGIALQDTTFASKLKASGVPYQMLRVGNAEHDLSRAGGQQVPSLPDVANYIQNFIITNLEL
jgi:acetyl esterase/lipase